PTLRAAKNLRSRSESMPALRPIGKDGAGPSALLSLQAVCRLVGGDGAPERRRRLAAFLLLVPLRLRLFLLLAAPQLTLGHGDFLPCARSRTIIAWPMPD